ncbi:MAG: hypothetical protein LBT81_06300 [Helicobacteraceae bacterium]|jgi:OOP family OmpA-OmpF porin|nr:hypothetical protein [Helicobacteraceae bacterium]
MAFLEEERIRWDALPEESGDPEIKRLKEMLFKRESAIIEQLKEMFDGGPYSPQEINKLISESIVESALRDRRIANAIAPIVEDVVSSSMLTHKNDFVDILFPLMGPSIRKSISENFRTMLESFSRSIENAISWRGIKWRFEALKSGKSFSDVVFLHTIVYRVEHIFFVHSETGFVLSHLHNSDTDAQDADVISAMLTAISDFVRDCFSGEKSDNLESLRMGQFNIVIEAQRDVYLACVIRGNPPIDFGARVRNTLDHLVSEFRPQINAFQGDVSIFNQSIRYLEALLDERFVSESKRFPTWGKEVAIALAFLLLSFAGYQTWQSLKSGWHIEEAVSKLNSEPGITVMSADKIDNNWRMTMLRDDLSVNPERVIEGNPEADNILFQITPFVSLEKEIIIRRIKNAIALPASVEMSFDDGVLTLHGTASLIWIDNTRKVLQNLPGIRWIDTSGLSDPEVNLLADIIEHIEAVEIEFPLGQAVPVGKNAVLLEELVDSLVDLEFQAGKLGLIPTLSVYGHADRVGNVKFNYDISLARSQMLAAMLYAKGSTIPISIYGMGSQYPAHNNGEERSNRRIELKVKLVQMPQVQQLKRSG